MGGGSSKTVGTNIVNDMVAQIFTTVALSCASTKTSIQNIWVGCNPPLDKTLPPDQQQPYENQATCKNCIAAVVADQKSFYSLQQSSWRYGGKIAVNLPIDQDYTTVLKKMIACGSICKACTYQNLSQSTIIQDITKCQSILSIQNTIDQKLNNAITQQLTNNQDFLAPLAQMLGASSVQQIVSNLTNRISTKITMDIVTAVANSIELNQTMVFKGGSADANTISQQSSVNSIVAYFQKTQLFSTIMTDEEWRVVQDVYNNQNTIGDLGNATVKALRDITKFVSSAVGKVVVAMLLLVAFVFVSVLIIGLALFIKKKVAEQKAKQLQKSDIDAKLNPLLQY
jgi:hypothetical protein